jgi:hypothetical protein
MKRDLKRQRPSLSSILDPRVDPSAQGNYALRDASREGFKEIVALLLQDPRVDTSARENEAYERQDSEEGSDDDSEEDSWAGFSSNKPVF